MENVKKFTVILFGLGLCVSIIYLINYISERYFEYSIPFWFNLVLMFCGSQILDKISPFKDSKVVLFEK
tara:strand:+ start:102 stop:308 length:207 start_codon:yes stop_codon:yes gene_type:complete